MRLRSKTVLGIDISNGLINLVLLRGDQNGLKLLKTSSAPVPDGAIKDGSVEDPAILSHAIRELKTRNKVRWTNHAAVSLLARPLVTQVIEMPKQMPDNMGQFVQNEMKRCVALSGKNIASDYCRLSPRKTGGSQLFVVAADEQKVAVLAEACSQAGLNVEAIEPPLIAYARALHAKKVAGKFDCNILMVILRGSVLTLCVFQKQTLDFVRNKDIGDETIEPNELCRRLAGEINSIIRFYDFEVADSCQKWEIVVVADSGQLPEDAQASLSAEVAAGSLHVKTCENAWEDTTIAQNSKREKPSAAAIGLAMGLLDTNSTSLRVNLVPPESAEVRSVKKDLLVTGNILAALFLAMILFAAGLSLFTQRVEQRITHNKNTALSQATHTLLRKQELLEKQIKQLSGRPETLNSIIGSRDTTDWAKILNDVRSRTPKTVRITRLRSSKDSGMYLEGLALSYEVVHLFVNLLNKSTYVESASLERTQKDTDAMGLVKYAIDCLLAKEKRGS